jgi:hypothetical protein
MRNGGVKSPPIFARKMGGLKAANKIDGCIKQPFFGFE